MKNFRSSRVAIVGAGPAGLAAAKHLAGRGVSVVVHEKSHIPGGRAGCDQLGAYRFDRGAEFVTSFYPRTLKLIHDAGLSSQLSRLDLKGDILLDGAKHPLPISPGLLLRTPLFSLKSKLRILMLLPRLLYWRTQLRWSNMERGAAWDDQSALHYFRQLLGDEYVRILLGPTLESFVVSPVAETSRVLAMAQLLEAPFARFYCVNGGMATLWESIAAQLPVCFGQQVVSVQPRDGQVCLQRESGPDEIFDAAIVAIPGPEAAVLLPLDHPERELAAQARYSPIVKLHACLDRSLAEIRPVCTGGIGHQTLAGIGNLESKHSHQVPEGKGSLHAWTGPLLGHELIDSDDDVVESRMRHEAESLLGFSLPQFQQRSLVRLRSGLPIFQVGWFHRLQERQRSLVPAPITLAGDYLASPSMEGAVRTGQEAADRVLSWLNHRQVL